MIIMPVDSITNDGINTIYKFILRYAKENGDYNERFKYAYQGRKYFYEYFKKFNIEQVFGDYVKIFWNRYQAATNSGPKASIFTIKLFESEIFKNVLRKNIKGITFSDEEYYNNVCVIVRTEISYLNNLGADIFAQHCSAKDAELICDYSIKYEGKIRGSLADKIGSTGFDLKKYLENKKL